MRTCVGVGEPQLNNEGLFDGVHSVLRVRIPADARRAVRGRPSAELEWDPDCPRGIRLLHHQLAEEHPEVRAVNLVAVFLVDGLQEGHDGGGRLEQAGAAEAIAQTAVGAH